MIDKKSLTEEWIKTISSQKKKTDPALIEKVVRALLLLEGLVETEINFIFKGGTSLMLMLNSAKRLSIDIDITIPIRDSLLEAKLVNIASSKGFTRVELNERKGKTGLEKSHYKFYYNPSYHSGRSEDNILLDILFEEVQYQNLRKIDINSTFLLQEGDVLQVYVPSFEDILGDKLTAFAPETTGIPYVKRGYSSAMEIIKQLYDIGTIFNQITDLKIVATTFKQFAQTELLYRGMGRNPEIVLEDIFQTALTISTRGKEGNANFQALQQGISQIKAFIFSESYHIEKAIIDAAKAAYLAQSIKKVNVHFENYSHPLQTKDWIIEKPFYTRLNKLKKSNPEAFFYWYKVYKLGR